jgi:hypothetical protein
MFLHHSVGSHLLADPGNGPGLEPNGGGARRQLTQNGYRVHEATYGSKLGEHTDLFDWLPKFSESLPEILRIEFQDKLLPEPERNRILLFKSCYPNTDFVGVGVEPGNPAGKELTLANAKATFRELLPIFAKHPDTLFVFLTTPPLAAPAPEGAVKGFIKGILGRPSDLEKASRAALLARQFHDWVVTEDGWLGKDAPKNVAVFDLYDVLTRQQTSLFLQYATGDGTDSHPSSEAQQIAAKELVPFLNRAVRRAGLSD